MDTPPGAQATACCSRDCVGTWEDLCFPSELGEIVVSGIAGYGNPAEQNPTCWRKKRCGQQGEEQTVSKKKGTDLFFFRNFTPQIHSDWKFKEIPYSQHEAL